MYPAVLSAGIPDLLENLSLLDDYELSLTPSQQYNNVPGKWN